MKGTLHDQVKDLHLLLVDDDSFALRIIRHIIYGLGIGSIEEAFNGESAINQLEKHPCDILITDVQMPKVNGLELLKRIRCGKTEAPQDLPVLLVTSLSSSDVVKASLDLDVNGFLVKPMKPIVVHNKLSEALDEAGLLQLRPMADYEAVDTDLKFLHVDEPEKKKEAKAAIVLDKKRSPSKPRDPNRLFIRDLKPGMRLSQDILLNDGTLLLSQDFAITETTINRLHELRDVLENELIPIVPEDVPTE